VKDFFYLNNLNNMKGHWIDFEERFISKEPGHKTLKEIMSQKWKSDVEKLQEWFENEKLYRWLVDMKLDGWLWLQNKNKTWETQEKLKKEYAWSILGMLQAKEN